MPFAEGLGNYSPEELDAIIKAGGGLLPGKRPKDLKSALEQTILAAQLHDSLRRLETAQPVGASKFGKVARASQRMLRLLGATDDGTPHITPELRGGAGSGLAGQGFAWARRMFKAVQREKRVATLRRSRERRLIDQGLHDDAAAARAAREMRLKDRETKRLHWRRMHGGWPAATDFPTVFETSEGYRSEIFGEDIALTAAVEGVQRIRTWAALEVKRLSKSPPQRKRALRTIRKAQTVFVGRLAALYPKFFMTKHGRFGVSKVAQETRSGKAAGAVGGPGIRFVQACLAPLGIRMKPEAIEKAWDTIRADNMGKKRRK